MKNKISGLTSPTGVVLGAALLLTLTGCIGYVDGPRSGIYVAPVAVGFVAEDDYVYYPGYEMYYGSRSHRWYSREGGSWMGRPSPRGVSVNVLMAAPAVNVNFHDSPAAHHAEISRSYPRNWRPAGGNPGRKDDQREDQRDERQNDHQR